MKQRKTRSDKGKTHNMSEASLQERVVASLLEKKILHYGTPNGVAEMLKAFAVAAAMRKRGAHAGVPDILVFKRGKNNESGMALELKSKGNTLSDAQQYYFDVLTREGWRCVQVASHCARTVRSLRPLPCVVRSCFQITTFEAYEKALEEFTTFDLL